MTTAKLLQIAQARKGSRSIEQLERLPARMRLGDLVVLPGSVSVSVDQVYVHLAADQRACNCFGTPARSNT